jgi:hypothetical protein
MGVRTCATPPHHLHLATADAAYRAQRLRPAPAPIARRRSPVTIPVVIHLLWHREEDHLGDAQLRSQVDVLNEDFRGRNPDREALPAPFRPLAGDALVEFALARRDPAGRATEGITRTHTRIADFPWDGSVEATARLDALVKTGPDGAPAWPREDYLNLWVCPLGGGLLGYAQFPGGAPETDGVVIRSSAFGRTGALSADYDLGRTCVHEVGHWLDLLHVWGDDGGSCTGTDRIADTPNQGGPNVGRPSFPSVSCGNGPDGDLFMNYMDYVDDAAMNLFTRDQVERMQACLDGPRASLARSPALRPPEPGAAQPMATASSRRSATSSA